MSKPFNELKMDLKISKTGLRTAIIATVVTVVIGLLFGKSGQIYASFIIMTLMLIGGSSVLRMAVDGRIRMKRLLADAVAVLLLLSAGIAIIHGEPLGPLLFGALLGGLSLLVGTILDVRESLRRGGRVDLGSLTEPYRFIVVFILFFPMVIHGFMGRINSNLGEFELEEGDHFAVFKKSSDVIAGLGRITLLGGLLIYLAGVAIASMAEYGAFMGIASLSMLVIVGFILLGHFRIIVEFFVVSSKSNIKDFNSCYVNYDRDYIVRIHAAIVRNGLVFLGFTAALIGIMGRLGLL